MRSQPTGLALVGFFMARASQKEGLAVFSSLPIFARTTRSAIVFVETQRPWAYTCLIAKQAFINDCQFYDLFMKNFWKIAALVFIMKWLYLSSGMFLPDLLPKTFFTFNDISVLDIFKRNDSCWYEKIATRGYPEIHHKEELGTCIDGVKQQSAWAFFPLYPAIIKATCLISGFSFSGAAFIWSLIFPVFGLLGFYVFTRKFFNDENTAFFSTVFLMLFPFHYYFSMYYTEALFLTLTMWSFIAIGSKKNLWLIPLLALTTLVRPNGLLAVVPLFLYFAEQNNVVRGGTINFSRIDKSFLINSLVFLAAPLTFALFCCYQYAATGYWNAFSLAQAGWCRSFSFPFTVSMV